MTGWRTVLIGYEASRRAPGACVCVAVYLCCCEPRLLQLARWLDCARRRVPISPAPRNPTDGGGLKTRSQFASSLRVTRRLSTIPRFAPPRPTHVLSDFSTKVAQVLRERSRKTCRLQLAENSGLNMHYAKSGRPPPGFCLTSLTPETLASQGVQRTENKAREPLSHCAKCGTAALGQAANTPILQPSRALAIP